MQDISNELVNIMSKEDCSSVYALFILSNEEKEDVHIIQPKSSK